MDDYIEGYVVATRIAGIEVTRGKDDDGEFYTIDVDNDIFVYDDIVLGEDYFSMCIHNNYLEHVTSKLYSNNIKFKLKSNIMCRYIIVENNDPKELIKSLIKLEEELALFG